MYAARRSTRVTFGDYLKLAAGLFVILGGLWALFTPSSGQKLYKAFSGICSSLPGQPAPGVKEAALFMGSPSGPVPTLLMDVHGKPYEGLKGLGPGWSAKSVSEVQLVVCVGAETGLYLDCGKYYYDNLAGRVVHVVEAKTGQLVGKFNIYRAYKCSLDDEWHNEYSVEAIRKILSNQLSIGKINPPAARYFGAADIQQDPAGRSTYIRMEYHRFQGGELVRFLNTQCSPAGAQSIRGISDGQIYHAIRVDQDTLQLAREENGAPIEITNMDPACRGVLSTDVEAE